jgi:hypothetical protein
MPTPIAFIFGVNDLSHHWGRWGLGVEMGEPEEEQVLGACVPEPIKAGSPAPTLRSETG